MNNKNKPAYPSSITHPDLLGLSKREYFAGLAMQGFAADDTQNPFHSADTMAETAVEWADALLDRLENEQ